MTEIYIVGVRHVAKASISRGWRVWRVVLETRDKAEAEAKVELYKTPKGQYDTVLLIKRAEK